MRYPILTLILFLYFNAGASGRSIEDQTGVLILAHGGSPEWNQSVIDAANFLKQKYPVEIAFGMAVPRTMQEGIDNLEKQGVNKIIVVPLFISSYSFIIRQSEYLLGLREELADPPLVMDHSSTGTGHHMSDGGTDHSDHNMGNDHTPEKISLERLRSNSKIMMTDPLNDHPLVGEILNEHITELSEDPSNEIVIIVGHGPDGEEDNLNWVLKMENLAEQIREGQKRAGKKFKMIYCTTVRDDADESIYNQAKENLRALVRQSSKENEVIIVPVLLSKGGIEQGIIDRLEGLDYKWNGKTLAPHQNISKFLEVSVEEALN